MHFSLDLIKIIVMKYLEEWNLNIGKPRKLGKTIEEIEEGDSLSLTESIEDQQLAELEDSDQETMEVITVKQKQVVRHLRP